jgi:hypothetical protein
MNPRDTHIVNMGLDGAPQPPNLALGFAGRHGAARFSRRKKAILIGLAAIAITAVIIVPTIIQAIMPGDHTSRIERVANTKDEMRAIQAAEGMDMARILEVDRFRPSE